MEHIRQPQYKNNESFDIPYICGEGYKYERNTTFEDFGPSLGWSKNVKRRDYFGSINEAAVILQKWLFFGLATEFFGFANIKVDTKDFVRVDEKGSFISTHKLNHLLVRWANGIRDLDFPSRKSAADGVEHCLKVAQVATNYLGPREEVLFSKVVLAVLILGATLGYARRNVFKSGGSCPVPGWQSHSEYRNWAKSKYLINRMESSGWCISEIAQMYSSSYSVMGIVFAAMLARPKRQIDHVSCTETVCKGFQINEDLYKTRHVRDDCSCSHLEPDQKKICSILHRGGIPIIQLSRQESAAPLQVEVIEKLPKLAYTAISHVWADGLGHATKNALPQCQFESVYHLLRNLENGTNRVCLWIDTLCIPSQPHAQMCPHTTELTCRKIAISRLKETYQDAPKVLVLDWEIERSNTSYPEETLMRIAISAWMKRLWTFQEAKLSKELHFRFKNKAIRMEDMIFQMDMNDQQSLWAEVADGLVGTRGVMNQVGDSQKIASLWNAFQGRATSKSGDEALSLSIMLGLDMRAILDTPDDERMLKLFSLLDIFPTQILFMPGPRISAKGYGWAPTSFLSRLQWANGSALDDNQLHHADTHTMNMQSPLAYRADAGLMLRSPGFILEPTKLPLFPYFGILDAGDKFLGAAVHMQDKNSPKWGEMGIGALEKLGIILESRVNEGGANLAVLVSDCCAERGIIFAKYVCRLWFGAARDGQAHPGLAIEKVEESSAVLMTEIAIGSAAKEDQMWCVS